MRGWFGSEREVPPDGHGDEAMRWRLALGATSVVLGAVGALTIGAVAIGALAVGAIAIGTLGIGPTLE